MTNQLFPSVSTGQHLLTKKHQRVLRVQANKGDHLKCRNLETGRRITVRDPDDIERVLPDDDPIVIELTYFSTKQLKERGWTDGLIRKYLSEPCGRGPNPYYKSAPPMKLWATSRVVEAEQTVAANDLEEAKRKKPKRSEAGMKSAETKRERVENGIEEIDVTVPELSRDKVIQKACDYYNELTKESGSLLATPDSEPDFLSRICVNYLRHATTDYDEQLDSLSGRVGKDDARIRLRERIFDAISEQYDWLREECVRQKREDRSR